MNKEEAKEVLTHLLTQVDTYRKGEDLLISSYTYGDKVGDIHEAAHVLGIQGLGKELEDNKNGIQATGLSVDQYVAAIYGPNAMVMDYGILGWDRNHPRASTHDPYAHEDYNVYRASLSENGLISFKHDRVFRGKETLKKLEEITGIDLLSNKSPDTVHSVHAGIGQETLDYYTKRFDDLDKSIKSFKPVKERLNDGVNNAPEIPFSLSPLEEDALNKFIEDLIQNHSQRNGWGGSIGEDLENTLKQDLTPEKVKTNLLSSIKDKEAFIAKTTTKYAQELLQSPLLDRGERMALNESINKRLPNIERPPVTTSWTR